MGTLAPFVAPTGREGKTASGKRRKQKANGVVIPIDAAVRRQPDSSISSNGQPPAVVDQARLQRGLELYYEEIRIANALREYRMQLEADLAAGAHIEEGDLIFDRELKVVRRIKASRPRR